MSQLPNPFGMNRPHPLDYAQAENPALVRRAAGYVLVGLAILPRLVRRGSHSIET